MAAHGRLEDSTREAYVGYVDRTIRPTLGEVSIAKLTARTLETLYAELRRCRTLCSGGPVIVHRGSGKHDLTQHRALTRLRKVLDVAPSR